MLPRVLFVEDVVPRAEWGAGYPRSVAVVEALAACAERVAVCPMIAPLGGAPPPPFPANVDIALGHGAPLLRALLDAPGRFDLVWAGRPHNLAAVYRLQFERPAVFAGLPVVYDAEAVFALRAIREAEARGAPMSQPQQRRRLRQELQLAEIAAVVAAVSADEQALIAEHTGRPTLRVGYGAPRVSSSTSFADRRGLLFLGAIQGRATPNADGLGAFIRDAMPLLPEADGLRLAVAGAGTDRAPWLQALAGPRVQIVGPVADLAAAFAAARVFVAPLRFGAGIPLKVVDAARHGVPVVTSSLVATQLRWRAGEELLVADTPREQADACAALHGDAALWTRVREAASAAVERDFSPAVFAASVGDVVALACGGGSASR